MKRRFNHRRHIMLVSLLLSLCFLMAPTALAAHAEPAPVQINRIMLSETLFSKHLPEESSAIYTPYREDYPSMTASNTAVSLTINYENGRCAAMGALLLNGTTVSFTASGDYYTAEDTADDALLFNFVGNAGTDVMTMNLSYDRGSLSSYIYVSIGTLSGNSAPIQLEFGGFTDGIYQVNEEYIDFVAHTQISSNIESIQAANEHSVTLANESQSPALGQTIHQTTQFIDLPNGRRGAAISLYAPSSMERVDEVRFFAKVTMGYTILLNYLRSAMNDSPSEPIYLGRTTIEMSTNDHLMRFTESYPESITTTVDIWIPYFFGTDPTDFFSYGLHKVTHTMTAIDQEYIYINGYKAATRHTFSGSAQSVNWTREDGSTCAPNLSKNGISVYDCIKYDGHNNSVMLYAKANITAQYVGDGVRPYSRVAKTFAFGEVRASSPVNIIQ